MFFFFFFFYLSQQTAGCWSILWILDSEQETSSGVGTQKGRSLTLVFGSPRRLRDLCPTCWCCAETTAWPRPAATGAPRSQKSTRLWCSSVQPSKEKVSPVVRIKKPPPFPRTLPDEVAAAVTWRSTSSALRLASGGVSWSDEWS